MNQITALVGALAPLVRELAESWGCTVTVYRPTVATGTLRDTTRTYPTPDAALTNVPAFLHVSKANTPTANAKPFGVISGDVGAVSFAALPNGTLPVLDPYDGIVVTSGPFTGYTYLCDAPSAPDPAGLMTLVTVSSAPAGVLP